MTAERPGRRETPEHVPVPHTLLVDAGLHTCDEGCPPVPPMPVFTWIQRARTRGRKLTVALRRLSQYRLVHRSRIDRGDD